MHIAGLLVAVIMLLISHQVEAECGGTSFNQDDAVLVCPLKEDASKTKQAVAVDYYLRKSPRKMVFTCVWGPEVCPKCSSDHGFERLGNITSVLIARVLAATLQNGGSYMSQFLVPDPLEPRFLCQAITPAPQHRLTTVVPMDMPAKRSTTERRASASFTSDDGTGADGQCGGLIFVVIILAVALCLALVVIGILVLQKNRARISRGTNSAHSPETTSLKK